MKVGIDFYDTLTAYPEIYATMIQALEDSGVEVYIISAVKAENEERARRAIDNCDLAYTEVRIIVFEEYDQVPELKLWACKELGIQMMIDDRADTCAKLNKAGILALCSPEVPKPLKKPKRRTDKVKNKSVRGLHG